MILKLKKTQQNCLNSRFECLDGKWKMRWKQPTLQIYLRLCFSGENSNNPMTLNEYNVFIPLNRKTNKVKYNI